VSYIYLPTREPWSARAVDTQLPPMPLLKDNGDPVLDAKGKPILIPAHSWLDTHRPVQQMTWAPGEPMLIADKLIADGGWFDKPEATCLNLYRPPVIKLGDAVKAKRWVDLVKKVYPEDWQHIIIFCAQRVQHPEIKINHSLMLGGPPGIGKDTILDAVKHAVGPWNFAEISPHNLFETFNGYIKSVVLRISEARDLGDVNRYALYEHTKTLMAAPPDVLRCNEKNLRQHSIANVTGVITTTNHKTDGIYLPDDDRRHYVAWSDITKEDFADDFWKKHWQWYADGGYEHVAAYLQTYDLSGFDPKAPPPKTKAFFDIITANCAPEESELADIIDELGNPDAITFDEIAGRANGIGGFDDWLNDRRNRKAFSHRMEDCGYTPVRNDTTKQGLWQVNGGRRIIYGRSDMAYASQMKAVRAWIRAEEAKARTKAEQAATAAAERQKGQQGRGVKF
jgi:Family of unknown function (DUF5906)